MKRLYIGAIIAAVGAWACQGDPTASLRGGPFRLSVSAATIFVPAGDDHTVEIVVQDAQLNPLAVPVTVTSSDAGVFTVEPDDLPEANGVRHVFHITAVAAGQAQLAVSGGGLNQSVTVNVLPLAFNGTASSAAPISGDTLVITGTAVLGFEPDSVAVTFAGGVPGTVVSATANAVTVLVPFADAGPVTIDGIAPNYVPGLIVSLPSTFAVAPTGDAWNGDDDITTAPDLALPAPGGTTHLLTNVTTVDNSASCPEVVLGFGSAGPCMIYKFTLTADTELNFFMDWDSGADLDFYVCPDADPNNCYEDGGSGATGNHPEETGAVFTAGTHYLFVELYAGTAPENIYVSISQP